MIHHHLKANQVNLKVNLHLQKSQRVNLHLQRSQVKVSLNQQRSQKKRVNQRKLLLKALQVRIKGPCQMTVVRIGDRIKNRRIHVPSLRTESRMDTITLRKFKKGILSTKTLLSRFKTLSGGMTIHMQVVLV